METSFFHRLSGFLWGAIVVLMVALAVYVSVGRMLVDNIGQYRAALLQELNLRVPFNIEAQQVSGEWQSFTPVIVLTDLRLTFPERPGAPLELTEGRLGVDVINSLRTGALHFTRVSLTDLNLQGELSSEGRLRLTGLDDGGGEAGEWLREFLLNVESIALRNNVLSLTLPGGEVRDLDLDLLLSREGSRRRLDAQLTSTGGMRMEVLGEGVGDPTRPDDVTGELYIKLHTDDLGAARDLLAEGEPRVWAEGALDIELWLSWDEGRPTLESRLEATDLLLSSASGDRQVPLQRVALAARLQHERNHWTLHASDLEVAASGVVLAVPRLQLDAWGSALRLRAADVPLAPAGALAAELDVLPQALREALAQLAPGGSLSALQVGLGDLEQAATDWTLEANFADLDVASYRGAPGITGARGYLSLAPGGGYAVVDSAPLTLEFPTIFDAPLAFDEVFGTLRLDWDARRVSLSSGLLSARGEEGEARALFGLAIPREPTAAGVEMDLLVGLENSRTAYRGKYLPGVLNPQLLAWLRDSIGEGRIEQGAFQWRGSLRPGMSHLRTVQLAFNIAATDLSYHPDWPALADADGVVYISDTAVSAWVRRGRLLDSEVTALSVETRAGGDGGLSLAVAGRVQGPAADGLAAVNGSPLAELAGGAFSGWQADGELATDLSLRLDLAADGAAPQVNVATRWHNVDLTIEPGRLRLEDVNGSVDYNSEQGFTASDLSASLWGQPVQATLAQQHPAGSYLPGKSGLSLAFTGAVELGDLRNWLQLEPLAFAAGRTVADLELRIAPGRAPRLLARSDLRGVTIDLPPPWYKGVDEARNFRLELQLGDTPRDLSMILGEDLKLDLDLRDGSLVAAALGVGAGSPTLEAGLFRIGGRAPLIDGDAWLQFVEQYFAPATTAQSAESPAQPLAGQEPPVAVAAPPLPLELRVEQLHGERLVLMEQELGPGSLSLALGAQRWRGALDTPWLRGALLLARDDSASRLEVEHLDLDRLADFSLIPEDPNAPPLDLPLMEVSLANLYQSERRLGELALTVQADGGTLRAGNITGRLAGLRLTPEQPAALRWRQGVDGQTQLSASLSFDDLGATLQYFGYERILQTGGGRLDVELAWPGGPTAMALPGLQGSMLVDIGQGSFLDAPSGAAGAVRVVSILNLADIVRRLSLSPMFESGIPFESVAGEVYFHRGTVEVARMDVTGSASFQFSGVSDVASESLQGELVATLPVARNLPWIAALAANLPVAAGVYIVSKVFDKQMNRLSSAVYEIGGSWDDPSVSFDRIFDDTSPAVPDSAGASAADSFAAPPVSPPDTPTAVHSPAP